jgi:CBS domain-containing protein
MKINEIISQEPVCVSPRTTVLEAAQTMKILDASMLPVCEHDGLVGTVTDRDIAIRAVAGGCDAKHTPIGEVMTEDPIYCFDDQEADEAVQIMREHEVRRLPVLNREKRLVGIISLGELAACNGNEEMAGEVLGRIAVGSLAARNHAIAVKMEIQPEPLML